MIQIKNINLTLLILCIFSATNAQQIDTIKTKKLFKKAILPVSLISVGVLINKSTFEKTFQTNIRNGPERRAVLASKIRREFPKNRHQISIPKPDASTDRTHTNTLTTSKNN